MCRRVPSEVRVLTWYRSQACGTFLEHSGSMRSLPEHSGTFLESFLGRFHRTQACGTFPEHSSKASSGGSTGLRRAERFRNIPRKLPREVPQDSGVRNVPGTFLESFLGSFHRTQACGTFLEHSGTFLGRTVSAAHIPYCIVVPYRRRPIRSRPFFFINLSRRYIVDRFRQMYGIGHTRQTAPHPVRSVKLSCLGPG